MRVHQRILAALLAGLLAVSTVAGSELPELGDVAGSDLPLSTEKKIGQRIMNEIRNGDPLYLDDPDVETYLNQLGNRLAAVSDDAAIGFFFFPVGDPSINAFAMPGGYIGVHTGLLLAAQSESELAAVLAHEISHVTQRHIARQISQSRSVNMAAMLGMALALLAARSNSNLAGAALATSQAGAISAQLAYSRDFEREADRSGFELLRRAGFDTQGMAQFFERLSKAMRVTETQSSAYLRTHPLSLERMSDMQNREFAGSYRQVPDSLDFQLVRARVRAQEGPAGDAVRTLRRQLDERKFASETAARYGLAAALARAGDWPAADLELQRIRGPRLAGSPMIERLAAEVRLGRGDVAGGLALYREAMVRFPLIMSLVYGYGQALTRHGRYAEAQRFAETQLQSYPADIRLNKLRAEGYAGQGRRAMQHLALAEVFVLQEQLPVAIEQLNQAQRAGDANFYEQSTIDARLRELKRRHAEELKERRQSW